MKIRALRLYNVKRFAGCGIALENMTAGVNVLCAANEAGKSTSFEALHALFFYPHSTTRKEMHRLRPYCGGNPLIEADIVTAQGQFRLTKQYHGKNFARIQDLHQGQVIAQGDEAENFIAHLVRGGIGSPAGLLWIRQGGNVGEKQALSQGERESEARLGLLQSVQGEVDALTGGRRMDTIMLTVAAELDKLVTRRGAKAGGRYALSIEEVERLEAEEQRLGCEVAALRQALDTRANVQKHLKERDHHQAKAEREREIAAAQTAFDGAKLHHEKVKAASAMLKLARQSHDLAKQNLENFFQAQNKHSQLQQKLQQLGDQRDQAAKKRHLTTTKCEQLLAESEQAALHIHALQQQLLQLEAKDQLTLLKQQFCQAQQLHQTLQQVELSRSLIRITPKALEELHALDIEIATLQARLAASRAYVRVQYHADAAGRVTLGEIELQPGVAYCYDGEAQLEIPAIGTIILHDSGVTSETAPLHADTTLPQLTTKRQRFLTDLNVENVAQARLALAQAQELDIELAKLHLQLEQCAPQGLMALQTQCFELESMVDHSMSIEQNPAQLRALLMVAEQRRDHAQLEHQAKQAKRLMQEQEFVSMEGQLAALGEQLTQLQAITGSQENQDACQRNLSQQLDKTELACNTAIQQWEILQDGVMDLETARIRLQRLQSAHMAAIKEVAALRENLAGLNAAIEAHCDQAVEEKWHEVIEALDGARARLVAEKRNLAVLQRLASALETARRAAQDLYLMPVMRELKPLLSLLFEDMEIHFDEKTLQPLRIRRARQEEDIAHLSGGMREQISILTRLAFARLLARDGREVPVILDDALVYCDDDRIEKMFDALHHQAQTQQIIVFSCRSRAFARLGGTVLQMADWEPPS